MYASGGFINISLDGESKEDYGFVLIEPVENESILTNEMGGMIKTSSQEKDQTIEEVVLGVIETTCQASEIVTEGVIYTATEATEGCLTIAQQVWDASPQDLKDGVSMVTGTFFNIATDVATEISQASGFRKKVAKEWLSSLENFENTSG